MRHTLRRAAVATTAVAASLALSATTAAAPLTGGTTKLKPDPETLEGLADMSIGIEATGRAEFGPGAAEFPITGGDVDTATKGSIEHTGGLAFFTEGGPSVKFSKFFVELRAKGPKLFAKSGGAEVRFMDLDLEEANVGVTESSLIIKGAEAELAKEGAEVLTETFDFPFRKGIPAGTITVRAQGEFGE